MTETYYDAPVVVEYTVEVPVDNSYYEEAPQTDVSYEDPMAAAATQGDLDALAAADCAQYFDELPVGSVGSPTAHCLDVAALAAAAVAANEKDELLGAKLRHIVSELRRCQLANGGKWAGPIPEKYFEIMTTGVYIWSPQYTIHKLLMGLLDTYKYTGNKVS